MSTLLSSKTPTVTTFDNHGLSVRDIVYHRHPDAPDVTREYITRHHYDARGFLTQSADPRLYEKGRMNFSWLRDLAGNVLRQEGADNGTSVMLNDAAGRPFISLSPDTVVRTWQYEDAECPGRLLSVTEQVATEEARIAERFVYAGNTDVDKAMNLAGQSVSHYDTAGLVQTGSIALTGVPLSVTRRLLKGADDPDTVTNWQGKETSAWNDLLDAEGYTTLTTVDATGAVLTTTDAKGHRQRLSYDVAGLLSESGLTLKGGTEKTIVKSLTYSAAGQKLREEHGNGVVTIYTYEAETRRLISIKTERPAGHASGARVLQDLRYEYDPVGNVLSIRNDAEETRFWRNQKVVPENTYTYDSLYQLVSATGREMANISQQSITSPTATVPLPTDSSAYTRYTRTYTYDTGGNLTRVRHSAPTSGNSYTTDITVSSHSNRGVLSTLTENPSDVDALFTAGGQQTQLQPGQTLSWTPRNELQKVTPVVREGDVADRESYRYDADSQRILKTSMLKTGNSTQKQRVLYLPVLEVRTTVSGENETENLQVIIVGEAGRAQVRLLHWESGRPAGINNNQLRYSYDNLTGGSQLELDEDGNIISIEEYYPYGGTAVWAARNQIEAAYKIIRYSGKERDATGLYYYGYRYYQPWAGRWLSADPAGTVDGVNLFRMVRNNPLTFNDPTGMMTNFDFEGISALTAALDKLPFIERNQYGVDGIMDMLVQSSQILDAAIQRLDNKKLDKSTKEEMRNILAFTSSKGKIKTSRFKDELLGMFINMKDTLDWNIRYDGEKLRFKNIKGDINTMAYVTPGDWRKRNVIHLTERFLQVHNHYSVNEVNKLNNIITMIHEASHFRGTKDYFYAKQPSTTHVGNFIDDVTESLHDFNKTIGTGLDKNIQEAIQKHTAEKVKDPIKRARQDYYGGKSRLKIAFGNADHIAIMAMRLGHPSRTGLSPDI